MFTVYNGLAVVLTVVLAFVTAGLLVARTPNLGRLHQLVRRLARAFDRDVRERIGWLAIAVAVAVVYAAVVSFDLASGQYGCRAPGITSDPVALFHSGQAFWTGNLPFVVTDCGTVTSVPYGFAAVLLDALGSLGGLAGIAAVWGLMAIAVVPLTWSAAGPDRRYVTVFVVLLPIFLPLVASQVDGASNTIVPVAILSTVVLAPRAPRLAEAIGGFLATARFPSLFPVVAARGVDWKRMLGGAVAVTVFVATTALTYARWGSVFYRNVFEGQINRRSFSLNLYGPLLDHGALPTGMTIIVVQAVAMLAVTAVAFFLVREPLRAAGLTLVGYALVTPFLSFSILVALVPVALLGHRARWWLWGVALVGAMNYDLALDVLAWTRGILWPSELLDVVLTALLLGLFVDLWRDRGVPLGTAGGLGAPPGPG